MEVYGKGGGQPFQHRTFKKKDSVFKTPTISIDSIVFSYVQTKDAVVFIKSNKAMSRYVYIKFKVGGPMAARAILSSKDPYLNLPENPDYIAGKVAFLKW